MKMMWFFIRMTANERKWLLLGSVLALITLLAGIGLLSLSGWLITASAFAGLSITSSLAFNYLLPSAGVRLFSLLRIIGRYGERVVNHDATFRILTICRVWGYGLLERLAPGHLLLFRSGDLLNHLMSDIDAFDNFYLRSFMPMILVLMIMMITWIYLGWYSAELAFTVEIFFLIALIGLPSFAYWFSKQSSGAMPARLAILRAQFIEYFQCATELSVFSAEKEYLNKIKANTDALLLQQYKLGLIKATIAGFLSALVGLMVAIVLYLGGKLIANHLLDGAHLALIVFASMAAFECVLPLPFAFQAFGKTQAAVKRLFNLAALKPAVIFTQDSPCLPASGDIVFSEVSFSYPNREPVLNKMNLHVRLGEKVGVMGPSGAGKSTLIHLLTRCWDPQSGLIEIGGVDLRQFSEGQLRSMMTVISQQSYLFNLSIRENLLLAKPSATDEMLWQALRQVQLADTVENLPHKLDTWVGERGRNFSGGQVRRLVLAQAVLHNAPIWLLDEPTEGLDDQTAQRLMQVFIELMRDKTVIMVSHQLKDLFSMDYYIQLRGERLCVTHCGKTELMN